MLAVVVIVVVMAVSGLAFYALRTKQGLKVSASLLKLASFTIEIESAHEGTHPGANHGAPANSAYASDPPPPLDQV